MTFIRSDALAAQVLQASLKDANGTGAPAGEGAKAIAPPPPTTVAPPPAGASVGAPGAVEAKTGTEPATSKSFGPDMSGLHQKVADFASALDAMKDAVKAMGDYMAMAIESDDASAVGYASKMFDQAWDEAFGGGGDVIDGEAVAVAGASEGVEELTVEEEFKAALAELEEMVYDNEVKVTAEDVNRIMGTEGNDKIEVSATNTERVEGRGGNDSIYIEAKNAYMTGGGKGDDNLTITADVVEDVWDGGGNDTVSITADKATEIEIGKGDDVYNLNVGEASVRLREMGGNDTINLSDGAHLELNMPTGAMLDDAASAAWEGDTLVMSFSSGDSMRIENASNAGSISIRAGETSMKLMDGGFVGADVETSAKVLDAAV